MRKACAATRIPPEALRQREHSSKCGRKLSGTSPRGGLAGSVAGYWARRPEFFRAAPKAQHGCSGRYGLADESLGAKTACSPFTTGLGCSPLWNQHGNHRFRPAGSFFPCITMAGAHVLHNFFVAIEQRSKSIAPCGQVSPLLHGCDLAIHSRRRLVTRLASGARFIMGPCLQANM